MVPIVLLAKVYVAWAQSLLWYLAVFLYTKFVFLALQQFMLFLCTSSCPDFDTPVKMVQTCQAPVFAFPLVGELDQQ